MNYNEIGFRPFYHQFCVLPFTESIMNCVEHLPKSQESNGYLAYGYIDHDAGLTLEVIAAAKIGKESVEFFEASADIRSFIRIGAVADVPVMFEADEGGGLARRYADRMAVTRHYDADEEVEKTRGMAFLDDSRHEYYIDDVQVYLVKEGNQPEVCWARICGLGEKYLIGELLNEPNQDFGYHAGEKIAFFAQEMDDHKIICVSNMNPSAKITAEELEDGSILEAAINRFSEERNESNFLDVLEILRDSFLWVPCNAVLSDEDQQRLMLAKKGDEFIPSDDIRLIPDILQNGEAFLFPSFTSVEKMGEYGGHFSKVQKHTLEIIAMARSNKKELAGIVINAFSGPFILDKEIWDIVEKMKSRICD